MIVRTQLPPTMVILLVVLEAARAVVELRQTATPDGSPMAGATHKTTMQNAVGTVEIVVRQPV